MLFQNKDQTANDTIKELMPEYFVAHLVAFTPARVPHE
jgi:hypothetical protein